MKRFLFSTLAAAVLSGSVMVAFADVPHRKVYGYYLYNAAIQDGSYGWSSFYLDGLDKAEIIYPYGDETGIFAGACADDVFYAYEYTYDVFEGPKSGEFISYNTVTGKRTELGDDGLSQMPSGFKPQDMTYDNDSKTMYAVGFSKGESALYTVNLEDGSLTKITVLAKTLGTIASDGKGGLYGIGGSDGVLYKINRNDGSLEEIVTTGFSGMMQNQTMEFDKSSGLLYWACSSYDYDGARELQMIRIDLSESPAKVENLGQIGSGASLLSMYIPFAEGGEAAPASPADFKVVPGEKGAKTAKLSWTAPDMTFGGEPMTEGITGFVIERDGKELATLPASATEYQDDDIQKDGEYNYAVYAVNSVGNGGKARCFSFIGHDVPGEVSGASVTVGEGCGSATITWDAPTHGLNGGYFSEDGLTYKVVRLPDNKTVAENISETTVTDKDISRLGRYQYEVYSCNASGETVSSVRGSYVLGQALDLPMAQDFTNMSYFNNQWTAEDANGDNYTWAYSSEWGYYQFGEMVPCAEYIVNPGIENYGNAADEWLITPPLKFEAGKSYYVKVTGRCISEETLCLTLGGNNVYSSHEAFGSVVMKPADDVRTLADYEVNLPGGIDGVKCIGLHLTSPYPYMGNSYMQITGISVQEGHATGITNVPADNENAEMMNVYTIDGRLVNRDGSLDGLDNGVYIMGGKKFVVK